MDTLPVLSDILREKEDCFIPGTLGIHLQVPDFAELSPEKLSTFLHEIHHFHMLVGSTWGVIHVNNVRLWAMRGYKVLIDRITPLFSNLGLRIPTPIQRYVKYSVLDPLRQEVLEMCKDFSHNTKAIYYELGIYEPIEITNWGYLNLPRLNVPNIGDVAYGAWHLIEGAARLEDRYHSQDFGKSRYTVSALYDFISGFMNSLGLKDPLLKMTVIDIALNPDMSDIPIVDNIIDLPTLNYSQLCSWIPGLRFLKIIELLWKWHNSSNLPRSPQTEIGNLTRGMIDEYYLTTSHQICNTLGFLEPHKALNTLLDKGSFSAVTVPKRYVEKALQLRMRNPSIFAIQSLTETVNDLFISCPPFYISLSDKVWCSKKFSSNQEWMDIQGASLFIKSVTEQILCDSGRNHYKCPNCRNDLISIKDHTNCSFTTQWDKLPFSIENLEWLPNI